MQDAIRYGLLLLSEAGFLQAATWCLIGSRKMRQKAPVDYSRHQLQTKKLFPAGVTTVCLFAIYEAFFSMLGRIRI